MTTEHYIDERVREMICNACYNENIPNPQCEDCHGRGVIPYRECEGCFDCVMTLPGQVCNGTGRILMPDARPEIEVSYDSGGMYPQTRGYYWKRVGDSKDNGDPFDTKAEALAAARKALA